MLVILLTTVFMIEETHAMGRAVKKSQFIEIRGHNYQSPSKVVTGYFKWYAANKIALKSLADNILDSKANDTTYAYRVNFDAVEKYLTEIKKSGFVSDNYIKSVRGFFNDCAADLKKYPRYEGAYPKLDDDVILQIQEEEDITAHLNEITILSNSVSGSHAAITVFIKSSRLKLNFKLAKVGADWMIDSYTPQYLPLKN